MKELLVKPGIVTEADFESARKEAEEQQKTLEWVLVEKDLINDDQLGKMVAEELEVSLANFKEEKIVEAVLHEIPEAVARARGVVAFSRAPDGVKVAMRDPDDFETAHNLEKRLGASIIRYYITQISFED